MKTPSREYTAINVGCIGAEIGTDYPDNDW